MLQERRLFCGRLCEVGYHRRDRALFSLVVRGLVRGLVSANHVRGRLVELATIAAIGVCRAAYTYTHIIYMHIHSKIFHTHKHNTHTHTHTRTHTHSHAHTFPYTYIGAYTYYLYIPAAARPAQPPARAPDCSRTVGQTLYMYVCLV